MKAAPAILFSAELFRLLDPYKKRLDDLSRLPNGWDYGEGHAPTQGTRDRAEAIIGQSRSIGRFSIEIRPMTDGGIVITFGAEERFVDIMISASDVIDIVCETGIGPDYKMTDSIEGAPDYQIIATLKELAKCLSARSSYSNIRPTRNGLVQTASGPRMAGSLFLKSNAAIRHQVAHVITLLGTTPQPSIRHPYSGKLINQA